MKISSLIKFSLFGIREIIFKKNNPILGTIIVTDKCNLSCKHCAVNNITSVIYPYEQIREEMIILFKKGVRILFFCGGETFLWKDDEKTIKNLAAEAKEIGFSLVIIVTNGTFPLDVPNADLILLSLDGNREIHNSIRGDTFDTILENIRSSPTDNIVIYMAVNQLNKMVIPEVCEIVKHEKNIRAISFNFHTPYPYTEELSLLATEKEQCCEVISRMMKQKVPVFNLKSAFRHIARNEFPTPCRQCLVIENYKLWTCGRCIDVPGLCYHCGYFFAAEYALLFQGNIRVIFDMLFTYLKYI